MNEKQTAFDKDDSKVRPTKKQKELLSFIQQFIAEHGYSPSYREIMSGLDYTSVATVALHVRNLITRGHLRKRDHSARSLEVISPEAEPQSAPLPTNQVKAGEEKWLVDKIEYFLSSAEALPVVEAGQLDDLTVLMAALKVLGLDGAAQSFTPRLAALKAKLNHHEQ